MLTLNGMRVCFGWTCVAGVTVGCSPSTTVINYIKNRLIHYKKLKNKLNKYIIIFTLQDGFYHNFHQIIFFDAHVLKAL